MGIIKMIKGWWNSMFEKNVKTAFGVTPITSQLMDISVLKWMNIYYGKPEWVDPDNRIKTINFAKAVCSETARLTNLAVAIELDGGARAEFLKKHVDKAIMPHLREWVEYGCAAGTVIIKPNGEGADLVTPDRFWVIDMDGNRNISGIVFQDSYQSEKEYYTKLEYHRYLDAEVSMQGETKRTRYYMISNKTYKSENPDTLGKECKMKDTKWANLRPEVTIVKQNGDTVDSMLFGVFRMPAANNIDLNSPLGMAVFADAKEEMKDLDIAYSRYTGEIYDSETIELLDDRLLVQSGQRVGTQSDIVLPHHVHNVYANGPENFYQAIERPLHSDMRITGMNNLLSLIGYKCGYSNGYFVFDEKTGMVTATQVEADDRRTIQLIKDVRDCLQNAIDQYLYAESVFADLYQMAPVGEYEVNYSFGDITYNFEEDRQHHYNLATIGKYPWEEYYVEYLKYSREDARRLLALAAKENQDAGLLEDNE